MNNSLRRQLLDYLGYLAFLFGVVWLAALIALASVKVVNGAPVPPPPKEIPAAALPGKWEYRWGGHLNGTMWLFEDGSYSAVHSPDYPSICSGTWRVEGWCLVLTETVFTPSTGSLSDPKTYRVQFDAKGCAPLVGAWNDTPVVLSNPQR